MAVRVRVCVCGGVCSGKLVAFEITYHYAFGWFEMPVSRQEGGGGEARGRLGLAAE